MNSIKRRNIGIFGSLGVHLVVFLLVAFTGLLHFAPPKEEIVEIAFFGGGGGGGGGNGVEGVIDDTALEEETYEEPEVPAEPAPEVEETIEPDAIFEHSDNAEKAIEPPKPQEIKKGRGTGSGTGQGTGTGSGIGSGHGSGRGSGIGSGTGSGIGSGHGSGIGSGYGAGNSTGNPAIPPRLVRSPKADYPAAQRNAGIEGTSMLRLLVNTDGRVEDVTVMKSSGSPELDASAVAACYKWRFTSARNAANAKVRCYINVPITFRLRN